VSDVKKATVKQSSRAAASGKKPDAPDEIMAAQEVAEYLRCHYRTIYRLVREHQLSAFRLFAEWRFRRSDIERWINDTAVKPEDGEHRGGIIVRRRLGVKWSGERQADQASQRPNPIRLAKS